MFSMIHFDSSRALRSERPLTPAPVRLPLTRAGIRMTGWVGCLFLILFPTSWAAAATWVVNSTGFGDDFPNVQAAISSSSVVNGDTILLKDGTYTGAGNRDIDFLGKNVVVRSMSMNPQNCVINCQGTINAPHRAFLLYQGENASAWIQKIKIINGYTNYSPGAGIHIDGTSSPVIDGCIIQNCIAEGSDGGGISCEGTSAPVIQNSQIVGNGCGGIPPGHGGGIFGGVTATPAINTCTISGNQAGSQQGPSASGGGIHVSGGNIDFCTVASNYANGPGGGVYATGIQIADSDIWGNSTTYGSGGGVFLDGGGLSFSTIKANRGGAAGGGLYAQGASIGRCAITGNTCPGEGGGGVYSAGATFDRCTISGNTALVGGGVSASNTTFTNTIIWGNCASFQGNEADGDGTDSFICCCINTAGVSGSVNYVGTQVFTNPIFCAPASCNLAPTIQGTYTLGNTSPCLPGNSPCGTLIGNYPQGCLSAGADDASIVRLELRPPGVLQGPTDIVWSMPEKGPVRLAIFDVQGRRVADLVDVTEAPSGEHRTAWSARSDDGAPLARGVYFVRLETAAGALTRNMILLGH
jgi:hypothetical protein